MPLKLTTYYQGKDLPDSQSQNFFHSNEMFLIYEATPNYIPFLIIAYQGDKPVARLLAACRKGKRLMPPSLIRRCVVYGTGDYTHEQVGKEQVFGEMLEHLTQEIFRHSFLIEFRNLENPLFGYKYFRINNYFSINWLKVRNSLHGQVNALDRAGDSRRRQVRKGLENGAEVSVAQSTEEIKAFSSMLAKNYSSKVRKHFPCIVFFEHFDETAVHAGMGKIFIVKYKDKIIGGSVCVYSEGTSYLWFTGGMRKTYKKLYPGVLATWKALEDAHQNGFDHLEFMDAGLPFKKHGYRDFVLRFGGKQISTRRWFRFRWTLLNNILRKIYA